MFIVRDKRNGKFVGKRGFYRGSVDNPNEAMVFRSIAGIKNSGVGIGIRFPKKKVHANGRWQFSRRELPEWAEIIELDLTQTFNLEEKP